MFRLSREVSPEFHVEDIVFPLILRVPMPGSARVILAEMVSPRSGSTTLTLGILTRGGVDASVKLTTSGMEAPNSGWSLDPVTSRVTVPVMAVGIFWTSGSAEVLTSKIRTETDASMSLSVLGLNTRLPSAALTVARFPEIVQTPVVPVTVYVPP